jgi:hypothetical protein
MAGIGMIDSYDRSKRKYKKIEEVENKIREDFDNPDLTSDEIKTWIKYRLLFYKPRNIATRQASNILYNHNENSERGIVYDELLKLNKKTRNNYKKIIEIFEPVFNPGKKAPIEYKKTKEVFNYIMRIFVGKVDYDEEKLEKGFAEYPEDLEGYKAYYNLCKKYLGANEVNKYMKKEKENKTIKENKNIEKFVQRLDRAIDEFWLERRGMHVDVYEIAENKISVALE